MTSATARLRKMLVTVILIGAAGCRPSAAPAVQVADLTRELDRAEKRPPAGFETAPYVTDGIGKPSIVVPVPSRATWSLPLPRQGMLRTFVTVPGGASRSGGVRFRIGVSDDRIYEAIAEFTAMAPWPGWGELVADLSAYAGFKWSLFYRPDRVVWRVVLAADAVGDAPAVAVWGSPEIVTDYSSAREYVARRLELR